MQRRRRILLLGGTTEASLLVRSLTERKALEIFYSLAGVTKNPVMPQNVQVRMGGFGGVAGMVHWLEMNGIDGVIDATHPYACQITANAGQAASIAKIPFLRLERPAWQQVEGDQWVEVSSWQEAVEKLGNQPKNIFLTIGRKDLLAFKDCGIRHFYWIRSVDRPEERFLPENAEIITAKGPFSLQQEEDFLKTHHIDILVSKNSGGDTVYAKIEAARRCRIPIIMLQRKDEKYLSFINIDKVNTVKEALSWVDNHFV